MNLSEKGLVIYCFLSRIERNWRDRRNLLQLCDEQCERRQIYNNKKLYKSHHIALRMFMILNEPSSVLPQILQTVAAWRLAREVKVAAALKLKKKKQG